MTAIDIALAYVKRGWNPVPVPFKSKVPNGEGWQKRLITAENVDQFFNERPQNIGVLLGPTSGGLTDIDLDCSEAVALAPVVLQPTNAIFGRQSKRCSHYLYKTSLASSLGKATLKFSDPKRPMDQVTLLEVRVGGESGAQTVFPGSFHESGEEIRWEESGDPAMAGSDDVVWRARKLAGACLFARYWPGSGSRHDAALALGGFLSRVGMTAPEIKYLIEAIARTAGDPEYRDRMKAAEDAASAQKAGKKAAGYPLLKKAFGKEVAHCVADWLKYEGSREDRATGTDKPADGRPNDIITEDSAATQFVDERGNDLRYCHSTGAWFRWNVTRWTQDRTGIAFQWARELNRRLAENQDERKRYITHKTAFASGVERFAKVDPQVAVTIDYWDRDAWLIGTPGGTVDLRTGELRASNRHDGITKAVMAAPAGGACPRWLQFLAETTGDDQELIRFLQQWCGYCLTGVTREHALVFVYGPGGNGKTVFLNVVTTVMGDYATTAAMDTFTASHSDKHPTDLAMLRGARLVTASETEEGRAWAEAKIKQMTGGDRISARFMRQDFFEFVPQFKLMIVGNHKPVLRNVDEAARRRFNIVPFNRKPASPDTELEHKLMAEARGILQWMIEGCCDWQVNGLCRPRVVVDATETYFADQDLIGQWIDEKCEKRVSDPMIWDYSAHLFESWSRFATKAGEDPGKQKALSQSLQKRGFEPHRVDGGRGFKHIRLWPDTGGHDA